LKFHTESTSYVKDYGPHSTPVNTKFNVQPDDISALWFAIDDLHHKTDLVVEFDGNVLRTVRSGNSLSAIVPDCLLDSVREVEISVFDSNRPKFRDNLSFKITGAKRGDLPKSRITTTAEVKKPNLFIIGAPRSATTSLYWKLTAHPHVYMSKIKEPFFFDERAHGVLTNAITTKDEYLRLFRYTPFQAKVIGEASVTYLSSKKALRKIHSFNKNAKIIIMLRNPISASLSMYLRTLQGGKYENAPSFEAAWRQPYSYDRPFVTRYAELFMIGDQLTHVNSIFNKQNIKVILYDDLKKNSNMVYRGILDFLELTYDSAESLIKGNSANWDDVQAHIPKRLIVEMVEHFFPQVQIVANYTKRNLDHWLKI
jgi:hypothetical protein